MKKWSVKKTNLWHLEEELDAYSKQGWIIYQINYLGATPEILALDEHYYTENVYSIIANMETI